MFPHVDLTSDSGRNQCSPILLQPVDRLAHLGDERIDLRRLPVEEVGNGALLGEGGTAAPMSRIWPSLTEGTAPGFASSAMSNPLSQYIAHVGSH